MSLGILGDGVDIHGGGNDLVFPHHTNERAEALAVGRTFARHWVHNAMLNVDGTKMAKSLGNYRTVEDMLNEHPDNARAFRLLVLQTHYRKTMEVNSELLASARTAVQRLDALARRLTADPNAQPLPEAASVAELQSRFCAAMDHDLGTPEAMAVVFDNVRKANTGFDSASAEGALLARSVLDAAAALGLAAEDASQPAGDDAHVNEMVLRRQAAREAKDWATADALRDELSALGVVVEDTPSGPKWHRP